MKRRFAVAAGSLLSLAAGTLLLLQQTAGYPWKTVFPINSASIQQEEGSVYRLGGLRLRTFLEHAHPMAALTEDAAVLQNRVSGSLRVRTGGNGCFSIGGKSVWFKTTDGSDPRNNGRNYAMVFPKNLPPGSFGVILLLFAVSGSLGCWLFWGTYPWRILKKYYLPNLRGTPLAGEGTRQWGLDVLRALAILLVLFSHAMPCPESASKIMHTITRLWGLGGGEGVDLFFVLSGYLVSGLLWSEWRRTGSVRVGRFLCRRGFKIYPAFWVMLFGTLLCKTAFDLREPEVTPIRVFGEIAFLQNYVGCVWAPTWSLAVEEHFYFLLAFLFALLARPRPGIRSDMEKKTRHLPLLFIAIGVFCLGIRCLRVAVLGESARMGNYAFTHCRLDGLTFGVFLRHCQVRWPNAYDRVARAGGVWWVLVGLILFVPAGVLNYYPEASTSPMAYALIRTTNYLAAGCLVLSTLAWENWPWLGKICRPIRAIGRDSYSIYLWHMPVLYWVANPVWNGFTNHDSFAAWAVYFLVLVSSSILTGVLMSKLVEFPMLRLRDRLFPSLSRGAPLTHVPAQAVA